MVSEVTEHEPWVGCRYQEGLDGQRVAIVGYSHHRGEDDFDRVSFTKETVAEVIEKDPYQFFRSVRGYFGSDDRREFWNRVLFFNFLPNCVGTDEKRYADGTASQIELAQQRLRRLIRKYRPHRALVFSRKAWEEMPPTSEEEAQDKCHPFGPESKGFEWGTYDVGGFIVAAFGLRHPERASGEVMRRAVQDALAVEVRTN